MTIAERNESSPDKGIVRDFAADATPSAADRLSFRERMLLASYAMHATDSRGRLHAEPPHGYRDPFSRDRDRILHSSAFRRLSGKMQVFTGEFGTYHRTRLTHTLEVTSVARTIARVLRLNEDLVEALALMHDIGHPPFGHCGEDVLADCMGPVGGFSHNQFALTIVTQLEQRYQSFAGLNLSAETLAGQDTRAHKAEAAVGRAPLLEVQVVDLADSIAYDAHDVDDAIQMGLLSIDELSEIRLVRLALDRLRDRHGVIPVSGLRQLLVHQLVDMQVGDLLSQCVETLLPYEGYKTSDLCDAGVRLGHSESMANQRDELERFLFEAVYRHEKLIPVRKAAGDRIERLFETLDRSPDRLPLRFRGRLETVAKRRVIGEYIAGMTDQFCNDRAAQIDSSGPMADW